MSIINTLPPLEMLADRKTPDTILNSKISLWDIWLIPLLLTFHAVCFLISQRNRFLTIVFQSFQTFLLAPSNENGGGDIEATLIYLGLNFAKTKAMLFPSAFKMLHFDFACDELQLTILKVVPMKTMLRTSRKRGNPRR